MSSDESSQQIARDTPLKVTYTCENGHEPSTVWVLAHGALLMAYEHGQSCAICRTTNVDIPATVGRIETQDGRELEFDSTEGGFIDIPEVETDD